MEDQSHAIKNIGIVKAMAYACGGTYREGAYTVNIHLVGECYIVEFQLHYFMLSIHVHCMYIVCTLYVHCMYIVCAEPQYA